MGTAMKTRRKNEELADVLTVISVVAKRLAKSARQAGTSPPRAVRNETFRKTYCRRCK